ncbi:Leukocyte receptor cluster member 9 [Fasciola hepatica]|uniref:Leukocyte receptor cluster member 9 n=1 Tax=Fasciola hepatica TaxID=6192 RepID=A0A4E0QWY8_FASHE|nr:Leukocyte receptor cluster member 9 [Fasciola hepatica]
MSSKKDGEKKPKKKPPMRTAMDVVKRIMWDDKIPESLITIGYEDRFLGILEKPFDEFSWEPLDTLDYYSFGVPEHRIQYFKYRDTIVWDKRERLDNVYGSTGSGISIEQAMEDADESYRNSIELPAASQSLKEQDSDSEDDAVGIFFGGASGVRDQTSDNDEEEDNFWQNKLRPNFFICQRADSHFLREKVVNLQSHVCQKQPLLESCCIQPNALHITLRTLRLDDANQVSECVKALKLAKEELEDLLPSSPLAVRGVNSFHNRVVYAAVELSDELSKFVDHLDLVLRSTGLTIPDGPDFVPHITLVKLSRPVGRQIGTNSIDPALYADFEHCDFGVQPLDAIYLCSMEKTRDSDGFYVSPVHVTFMRPIL